MLLSGQIVDEEDDSLQDPGLCYLLPPPLVVMHMELDLDGVYQLCHVWRLKIALQFSAQCLTYVYILLACRAAAGNANLPRICLLSNSKALKAVHICIEHCVSSA